MINRGACWPTNPYFISDFLLEVINQLMNNLNNSTIVF